MRLVFKVHQLKTNVHVYLKEL